MKNVFSFAVVVVVATLLAVPVASGQQDWPGVYIDAPKLVEGRVGFFSQASGLRGQLEKYGEQIADALKEAIGKKTPVSITSDESTARWKIDSVVEEINDGAINIEKRRRGEETRPEEFVYTIKVVTTGSDEAVFDWNFRTKVAPFDVVFKAAAEDFADRFKRHLEN